MKRLSLSIATVLIFFIVWLSLMLSTTAGLRTVVTLSKGLVPGRLSIAQIHGRLLGEIQLSGIQFKSDSLTLNISDVDFDWRPRDLFIWHIHINKAHISGIDIRELKSSPSNNQEDSTKSDGDFSLPIPLTLNDTKITDFRLTSADNSLTELKTLSIQQLTARKTLRIQSLFIEAKPNTLALNGTLELIAPYKTNLHGKFSNASPIEPTLKGDFKAQGDLAHTLHIAVESEPKKAFDANITLKQALSQGQMAINAHWQQFTWAIDRYRYIQSQTGKLSINGDFNRYTATLSTQLSGNILPKLNLELAGVGSTHDFKAKTLNINSQAGTINGQFDIAWQPALQWQADIRFAHINPGVQWAALPGDVSANLKTEGSLTNTLTLNAALTGLHGQLQHLALSGQAQVNIQNQTITVKPSQLVVGPNTFRANGVLGPSSDFQWTINAPNMAQVYPNFKGQLKSSGTLSGKLSRPIINASVHANDLTLFDLRAQSANIKGRLDTSFKSYSHFFLNLNRVYYKTVRLKTAYTSIKGDMNNHHVYAHIDARKENLYFDTRGAITNHLLTEKISQLSLSSKRFGRYALNHSVTVHASAKEVNFTPFCWQSNTQQGLCFKGNWKADNDWLLTLSINRFNIGIFNPFLPGDLHLQSIINGKTTLQGDGNSALTLNSQTLINNLTLHLESLSSTQAISLNNSQINIKADSSGLTLNSQLNIYNPKNAIHLALSFPKYELFSPMKDKQEIKGKLTLNISDLKQLTSLIPDISSITGNLAGSMILSGNTEKPMLNGKLQLHNGAVSVPDLGLNLKNIGLSISANRSELSLDSELTSGQGTLKLNAIAPIETLPLKIQATAKGSNVTVINNKEYHVVISPDLTLSYFRPDMIITGDIDIPFANISPKDFSSATTLPSNFEIITPDTEMRDKALQLYIQKLKISLGKKVHFNYMGLDAGLTGDLTINSKPHGATTGVGRINVENGMFRAYGKKLEIKQGNLIFSGESIDNPGLNIEAIKVIPVYNFTASANQTGSKVTVGIIVTGTAMDPSINLYSIPSMSQTDILSYLLFDKPSSSVGGSSAALLGQTASLLAADQTQGMTSNIENSLGLSTIGVESSQVYVPGSTGPQSTTSFVIGKRLSKRLQALYSVGISIPVSIIMLQYQISQHWQLQTQTSSYDNGADILYTIESG